jgi:chemotaxis protein methyltransferase CheR
LIYFDKYGIEDTVNNLCANCVYGGYLFIGHSESVKGLNVPLESVAPTTYQFVR